MLTGSIKRTLRDHMKRTTFIDIISSVLLLLLVYTAISKIVEYESFQKVLSRSPLLNSLSQPIARFLPVIELAIGALLFFPATRIKGLYATMFLLIIFTIYLDYMILFAPNLPFSCGGVLKKLSLPEHIAFNLFFILLDL